MNLMAIIPFYMGNWNVGLYIILNSILNIF